MSRNVWGVINLGGTKFFWVTNMRFGGLRLQTNTNFTPNFCVPPIFAQNVQFLSKMEDFWWEKNGISTQKKIFPFPE